MHPRTSVGSGKCERRYDATAALTGFVGGFWRFLIFAKRQRRYDATAALIGLVGRCWRFLIFAFVLAGCGKSTPQPFETSYWYWHSPFQLSRAEIDTLQNQGVKRLFVRSGTFTTDGEKMLMVLPQKWQEASPFPLHLAFHFDSGAVAHFEEFDLDAMAEAIAVRVRARIEECEKGGNRVEGVQFDFDSPTRLLPRYAELIAKVRPKLDKGLQVSTTALMSWLDSDKILPLAKELDFIVPQAYEGVTGKTIDEMRPVADPKELERLLPKMERLACPVYVGIPAYGHAFVFDREGKLRNIWREVPPRDMFRSASRSEAFPSDRLGKPAKDKKSWVGEQLLKFEMADGTRVGYTIPTTEVRARTEEIVRRNRGRNVKGAIVYRLPDEGDSLALPLEAKLALPKLKVTGEFQADTYEAVDTGVMPTDLFITITNDSAAPTFVSEDALVLTVELDRNVLDGVSKGDALRAETGMLTGGEFRAARARDSAAVQFRLPYLAAGETVEFGPIRLLAGARNEATIRWKVRAADGFDVHDGEAVLKPTKP